ncbi:MULTISPECIES: hypothetical protein [Bradyrhizobium]|jgi:hypothetical protein|uniref:hypothetical protein n=1 Tax=Bradyrhizobium TaxID=374 RepID=UPI00041830DB|nr:MULTISPECIES: hypothetical protein [Bradyrhizobium]RZN24123.1 hypothetical protein CWO90_29435 [Bradyrhizobium sp. Leo121]
MRVGPLAALTLFLSISGASAAPATSASGSAALALAAVVAQYSPIAAAPKRTVASFFKGDTNFPYGGKISVTADNIVCRTSNVDITSRSCEITFKIAKRALKGRDANELFATMLMAGIPAEGAAGSNIAGLSKLTCTIDPKVIKQKAGGGADCTFEPGNQP